MKNLLNILLVFGATSAVALSTAFAAIPTPPISPSSVTVDEFGVGTYFNGFTTVSLLTGTPADPFNGGATHFAYTLPYNVGTAFDIVLTEPGSSNPSDLLRFVPDVALAKTLLFFYSDASQADPADAPADVSPFPTNFIGTPMVLTEVGLFGHPYSEAGPNGAVYFTDGGPGSDSNPSGTSYTFVSEVPEPSILLSMAMGAALLASTFRWRRGLRKTLLVFATFATALTAAFGQNPSHITVDEFGVGTYQGWQTPAVNPLTVLNLVDPYNENSGGVPRFAYILPAVFGAPFDILLTEPGSQPSDPPSDLLRFVPGGGVTALFFYSDASPSDPADSPADGPFPPNFIGTPLVFEETGLFGNPYSEAGPNGYVYFAAPGAPGWDGNAAGTVYTFISEVPEPSTLVSLALGAALLASTFRWRRSLRNTLLVFATFATALTAAFGQNPSQITVDEFGVGTYYNGSTTVSLLSGFTPDPFNSGQLHLAYYLPAPILFDTGPFDIVVTEPGVSAELSSDLLRFIPNDPHSLGTVLLVYSDASAADPADAPADINGLPSYISQPIFFPETGLLLGNPITVAPYTEAGPNGWQHSVPLGGIGSDGNPDGTVYTFISEYGAAVPEPSTLVSLALGAALLALTFRRRRRERSESCLTTRTRRIVHFVVLGGLFLGTNLHAQIYVTNQLDGTIGEYDLNGSTMNTSLVSGLTIPLGIAVSGSNLFVANFIDNTIGEYNLDGSTANPSLITGLHLPYSIAVSGSNLFVGNVLNNTIGEYNLNGSTVNASLITGLNNPRGIAVSGSNVFVTNADTGTIGKYNLDGSTVNAALITGLSAPIGIALSGSNLFVANAGNGTIGEYDLSGSIVNPSLITGLSAPVGIALLGSNLFVANEGSDTIGEYNLDGSTVNASLVSGLNGATGIAVQAQAVPEPSTWASLASGATLLSLAFHRRRKRTASRETRPSPKRDRLAVDAEKIFFRQLAIERALKRELHGQENQTYLNSESLRKQAITA